MDNFQERIILQNFFVDVFHNENFNKLLDFLMLRFHDLIIWNFIFQMIFNSIILCSFFPFFYLLY